MEDFDVRAAVLMGRERAVVWDTLAHPDQMVPVGELVGDLPITVVYSHADWDHAWGTCGLENVESVMAHEVAAARFVRDVPEELARRQGADLRTWGAVHLVAPTRTFTESTTLDLGGLTVELYALPGHTPDSIVGFVPEWGVLLAGDAVETPVPVLNDAASVDGWVRRLESWRDDARVESVVPAHGSVGGRDLFEVTASYLRDLAAGRASILGDDLPPFYRETHRRNLRLMSG
jgi:glyoxylase-like metal-dependent hydrolase (beta-lactamase superfamily II)